MLFDIDFISYNGLYRSIKADKINVPTSDGRRTILSNHMPIMLPLEIGVIEVGAENKLSHYAISNGMLLFENNKTTILCDAIIDTNEIDVDKAKRSLEKAEKKLESATKENQIMRSKIALARAANLISASSKYGNK